MRAILIDASAESVYEINVDPDNDGVQRAIGFGCKAVRPAMQISPTEMLWIDDAAIYNDSVFHGFGLQGIDNVWCGNGVVMGWNPTGLQGSELNLMHFWGKVHWAVKQMDSGGNALIPPSGCAVFTHTNNSGRLDS